MRKKNSLELSITINGQTAWEGRGIWSAAQQFPWMGKEGNEIAFFIEGIEYNLPARESWHYKRWPDQDIRQMLVNHIKRCIELHQEFYLEGEKKNDR